jgi:hypothetical protein
MSKNAVETEGPQMTSQYGAYTLGAGLARLYAHMRLHMPTRSRTHMHARAIMHTQANMQYLLLFHSNNITLYVHRLSCSLSAPHITSAPHSQDTLSMYYSVSMTELISGLRKIISKVIAFLFYYSRSYIPDDKQKIMN